MNLKKLIVGAAIAAPLALVATSSLALEIINGSTSPSTMKLKSSNLPFCSSTLGKYVPGLEGITPARTINKSITPAVISILCTGLKNGWKCDKVGSIKIYDDANCGTGTIIATGHLDSDGTTIHVDTNKGSIHVTVNPQGNLQIGPPLPPSK